MVVFSILSDPCRGFNVTRVKGVLKVVGILTVVATGESGL